MNLTMSKLVTKTISSLKAEGLRATSKKVGTHLLDPIQRKTFEIRRLALDFERRRLASDFERRTLALEGIQDRFTWIYRNNFWGSEESVSGPGSTIEYTTNLRAELPGLLARYSVKTVFDAPCGDFNWMKIALKENDLEYIGGDIVLALINSLNSKYKNFRTEFIHIDLTKDKLPKCDLMICRDCLFHFSFDDTRRFLRNFVDSGIPLLLTTTHINAGKIQNGDIRTGEFRLMDLFSEPYYFPRDVLHRISDWVEPAPPREMCLWSREQVMSALAAFG